MPDPFGPTFGEDWLAVGNLVVTEDGIFPLLAEPTGLTEVTGTVTAVIDADGTLNQTHPLVGSAAVVASASGSLAATTQLTGTIVAVVSADGTTVQIQELTVGVEAVVSVTGTLTAAGVNAVSGSVVAVVSVDGSVLSVTSGETSGWGIPA